MNPINHSHNKHFCSAACRRTEGKFFAPLALLPLILFLLCACDAQTASTPEDDLARARSSMRQRDFMEAEKSFERYLRRAPDGEARWEVWNRLVDLALDVRHDKRAAEELLEAMLLEFEKEPTRRRESQDWLARLYESDHNYDRALELWLALIRDGETPSEMKAESYRSLARIYLRRLEFELTKEVLGYCLQLDVSPALKGRCQYDLADAYTVMEDLDAASKTLQDLLMAKGVEEPLRVLAVFMLADVLEQQGKNDTALELFESIKNSYPNAQVVEERINYLKKARKSVTPAPPAPDRVRK